MYELVQSAEANGDYSSVFEKLMVITAVSLRVMVIRWMTLWKKYQN